VQVFGPSTAWYVACQPAAECTVNTKKSPYIGDYVTEQIAAIPATDGGG